MPKIGPGDDNVTGDRYTLDLGVEPDLGNLLSNLRVANELLDQAEDKFRTIGDVVASTTQRLAQATRQTELLAAQTQRVQNSYQQISAASLTLGGIGAMAGGAYGGYGMVPGQMAFTGMPPMQMGGGQMQTMPSGGRPRGPDEMEFPIPSPARAAQMPSMPRMTFMNLEAQKELLNSMGIGQNPAGLLSRLRVGYGAGRAVPGIRPMQSFRAGTGMPLPGTEAAEAVAAGLGTPEEVFAAGFLGQTAGGMGGLAGLAGSLATPAAIAYGGFRVAQQLYGMWAGQEAAQRRISGMTGGNTGLLGGVAGGGSLALSTRARVMGLLHPGVDYGRIQEEAMNAGYISRGGMYDAARDYLFQVELRGMGEMVDQLDLFEDVVDRAGGSTGDLTRALDGLRAVSRNTNASLTALTKNFRQNVETAISLGMSGGAATYVGLQQTSAYAQAGGLGGLSPAVRNTAGIDLTNPIIRASMANQLGVSYAGLPNYLYQNPGAAGQIPTLAESAHNFYLTSMGFNKDMTPEQVSQLLTQYGGDLAIPMLQQIGMPENITSYPDVITWILTTLGQPEAEARNSTLAKLRGGDIVGERAGLNGQTGYFLRGIEGTGYGTQVEAIRAYLGNQGFEPTVAGHPTAKWYEQYMMNTGGQTIPILDQLMQSGDLDKTYIKGPDGKPMLFTTWLRTTPNAADILKNNPNAVALHTATDEEMRTAREDNLSLSDVFAGGWKPGEAIGSGLTAEAMDKKNNGKPAYAYGGTGGDWSQAQRSWAIAELAPAIGKSVADNS